MTRMIAAVSFGVACSMTLVAAQAGNAMADDKMAKSPTVTVTGCVAEGTMADHYMLKDAMVSDADGMMKHDAKSGSHPTSFALSGGELKPHVGHKVEVTGTISTMGHMDKDKMSPMAESAKAPTLKVKTVKMIASACS